MKAGKLQKFTVNTLVLGLLFTGFGGAAAPRVSAAGETPVGVWMTTGDKSNLLTQQPDVAFGADSGREVEAITVNVDEQTTYQSIDGFGGSLTDSSAWLIHGMEDEARSVLMNKLFGRTDEGIGMSYVRLPMGASDFARSIYTYNDIPAGETDLNLERFSIEHDSAYIIPVLKEALAINPQLKIMASPWSAPAWMKDNGSLIMGKLKLEYYGVYADYFVKFIQAYEAEGIPIDAITLQNEPHHEAANYPGMRMEPEDQAELVKHLGPAFEAAGITTKILVWDHNWDEPDYPIEILNDPEAKKYIAGSAFHGYAGKVENQAQVHDLHPDKDIYFTESSGGEFAPDFGSNVAWDVQNLIIGATRNWAKTSLKWNIALNNEHGPRVGGCADCRGIVTIDEGTGSVKYNEEYYAYGQASKFVLPGAVRIKSNTYGAGSIEDVAYRNPDGSKVLLVLNSAKQSKTFKARWGTQSFTYTLPAGAVATFVWNGEQSGIGAISPYSRTEAEEFNQSSQIVTGIAADDGGGQYTAPTGDGGYIVFDQVEFVNGTASLRVRAAAEGDGRIEFRLDSPAGAYAGGVDLSDTGGLQAWKTKTVQVDGIAGTHKLYAVFTGNVRLNWFQFSSDFAQDGNNYLSIGGGFEEAGLAGWNSWSPEGQPSAQKADGEKPRTGNYKLTHYANEAYQQTTYRTVKVPNGMYKASVWYQKGGSTNVSLEAKNYGGPDLSVSAGTTGYVGDWTQIIIPAIPVTNGQLEIGIHSNNAANEWAAFDDVELVRITTKAPASAQGDGAPETPQNVAATLQGGHNIKLDWSAVEGAAGYKIFRSGMDSDSVSDSVYADYRLVSVVSSATGTYTDQGLRGSTSYSYRITAYNATGESAASASATATTEQGADTIAPAAPIGLTAEPGVERVMLVWEANTDSDFLKYNVYVNGVKRASVDPATESRYTVAGLKAGQRYEFSVTAVDQAGNESARSEAVSATPTAAGVLVPFPNLDFEAGTLEPWQEWHPEDQALAAFVDSDSPRGQYKLTHWGGSAYKQSTYRTLEVPNGNYKVQVWVRTGGGQNTFQLEVKNYGGDLRTRDLRSASGGTWTLFAIDQIAVTEGKMEISVFSDAKAGNWAAIDDFEIYSYPSNGTPPTEPGGSDGSGSGGSGGGGTVVTGPTVTREGSTSVISGLQPKQETGADNQQAAVFRIDASLLEKAVQGDGVQVIEINVREAAKGQRNVQVTLPASALHALAEKNDKLRIIVAGEYGSYELPLLAVDSELSNSGAEAQLRIAIRSLDGEEKLAKEAAIQKQGGQLLGQPVAFTVWIGAGNTWKEVKSFGSYFPTRTLPLGTIGQPASATGVMIDEAGGLHPVLTAFNTGKDGQLQAVIRTNHNSVYAVASVSKSFADTKGHWAEKQIQSLSSRFILNGVLEDRFAPERQVTRAEWAAMLTRALGLAPSSSEQPAGFSDVSAERWYGNPIAAAAAAGLMQGLPGGKFEPEAKVTRQEMAASLARALSYMGHAPVAGQGAQKLESFKDRADMAAWALPAMTQALDAGLITGKANGYYYPNQAATRAEAAAVLYRLIEAIQSK
ncbi:S-layer homology domain-containing protein [Paenibacillus radicis (ex Gao et al. 2016)]|nr:S-layer homology domain-containing protein [Paenibacillus radicis (ex Gao et al. 2016)]